MFQLDNLIGQGEVSTSKVVKTMISRLLDPWPLYTGSQALEP